jgi:hypothetical protein
VVLRRAGRESSFDRFPPGFFPIGSIAEHRFRRKVEFLETKRREKNGDGWEGESQFNLC